MSSKSKGHEAVKGDKVWSRKTITTWAVLIAVVFAAIVVVYPMLFNAEDLTVPAAEGEAALPPPAQ